MKLLLVARAAIASCYLIAPDKTLRTVAPDEADRRARGIVRLLGVRQLAQVLLGMWWPTPGVARIGAGVDAAHACSMVGLALLDRKHRRLASIDACLAGTLAIAAFTQSRNKP